MATDRRQFISELGRIAATSSATLATLAGASAGDAPSPGSLPTITVGTHRITRLVVGSNPLLGYSYLGPHVDNAMKEYFTPDQVVEFLLDCEQAGINAHQFSYTPTGDSSGIIRKARDRGSKLNFFCLARNPDEVRPAIEAANPFAMVHHGGVTDSRFAEGKSGLVHDFVKAVHDGGLLAGVSAHNPDCIKQIADEGWEVDFFMTCFYYLTRKPGQQAREPVSEPDLLHVGHYPFYRNDPQVMTQVVRQVDKPCFGFKILGAGRKCADQNTVREAFRFAFENIKPTDGVIVGMFPKYFDEIKANTEYARTLGG
ncbi:MAG: hypothetical protein ACYC6Y_27480 [Thermoguttaceae bacterium]